jgi:DNA polymerase III delta prime subunit
MDTAEQDPKRPRCLEDMAGATEWSVLKKLTEGAEPPHIVVAGPAGIGKSCAIRHSIGSSIALWMRCSQDPSLRGESRERIKAAARRRVQEGTIHWIVLEHADLLHSDAQAFLRRIIETSTGASRFVLEACVPSAISEPLLSRAILFNAPLMLPYEIRTEIQKRAPGVPLELADRLAKQSQGNLRWAILQGLGAGESFVDPALNLQQEKRTKWQHVLHVMEQIQQTGSYPRVVLGETQGWDRPGGICPWALTAKALSVNAVN